MTDRINSISIKISDVGVDTLGVNVSVDPDTILIKDLDNYDQPCVHLAKLLLVSVAELEQIGNEIQRQEAPVH